MSISNIKHEGISFDITYAAGQASRNGNVLEVLNIAEDGIDASRIESGQVRVLVQSGREECQVVGRVVGYRTDGGSVIFRVETSKSAFSFLNLVDVFSGSQKNISVAYEALDTQDFVSEDAKDRVRIVKRWRPFEIFIW